MAVARSRSPRSTSATVTSAPPPSECLTADVERAHDLLRYPAEHWARIRHFNLIERIFGETDGGRAGT